MVKKSDLKKIDHKEINFNKIFKLFLTNDYDAAGELFYYIAGNQPHYYYIDEKESVVASSLICNDIWAFPKMSPNGNPYYYREFRKYGVKVVFCSVNCNVDVLDPLVYEWHENHLRLFSREFGMYTVVLRIPCWQRRLWIYGSVRRCAINAFRTI